MDVVATTKEQGILSTLTGKTSRWIRERHRPNSKLVDVGKSDMAGPRQRSNNLPVRSARCPPAPSWICRYRWVIWIVLCPRTALIAAMFSPFSNANDAKVCADRGSSRGLALRAYRALPKPLEDRRLDLWGRLASGRHSHSFASAS